MYITDKHIAISMLQAKINCIERSNSGKCSIYSSNCDDCYLNYAKGTTGEHREALKLAIECITESLKNGKDN